MNLARQQLNLAINELIVKATMKLEEIEKTIVEKIDDETSKFVQFIDEKEIDWLSMDRESEVVDIFNEFYQVLDGSIENEEEVVEVYMKAKSFDEKMAEIEHQPETNLDIILSGNEEKISDFCYRVEKMSNEPRRYFENETKIENEICKLISDGKLTEFKKFLYKLSKNIRRYVVENEIFIKQSIRDCKIKFLKFFMEDCQIPMTDELWSSLPTEQKDLQPLEQVAEYLVSKRPVLAKKMFQLSVDLDSLKLCRLAVETYNVSVDNVQEFTCEPAIFRAVQLQKWNVFRYLLHKGAKSTDGTIKEVRQCTGRGSVAGSNVLHGIVSSHEPRAEFIQECLSFNRDFLYERNRYEEFPIETGLRMIYSDTKSEWLELLVPVVPNFVRILNKSTIKGSMAQRRQWQKDQNYIFQLLWKSVDYENESDLSKLRGMKSKFDWTVREPKTGMTLLHRAAKLGNRKAVDEFVKEIGVNCRANNGQTALHLAVSSGHRLIVFKLTKHYGANVALVDDRGRTAFDCCSRVPFASEMRQILTNQPLPSFYDYADYGISSDEVEEMMDPNYIYLQDDYF